MFPRLLTEDTRGPDLLTAEWLTLALSLMAIGLRLHGRCLSPNIPGWDDYTVLAATIFGVAQAAISVIQVENRFGHHTATLSTHQVSATIMWTTINRMLQIFGTLLVRMSACLLVLRMPPVGQTKQQHGRGIYMLMVLFVLFSATSFFLVCFQCTPLKGLWDRSLHAHCVPTDTWRTIQKVDGSFEVIMNFLTASLPFIFLINLQTSLREKWGFLTIVFLAYGTAGASICRVYCGIDGDDPSWDLACVEICLSVEQNIGTVITTLPTLGDPFLIFLNHTRGSLLGRFLWPDPPLPSCWQNSQNDDIHMRPLPDFPSWHFDPDYIGASEDVSFWHAVDSQMESLNFEECARPLETYSPRKSTPRKYSKTRPRWSSRPNSLWGSRSSRISNGTSPISTTPHGSPPKAATPTSSPPEPSSPISTPPKSTTPGSSTSNSQTPSRGASADGSTEGSDRRSFRSRISRPSSWLRWSWRTGDDPGYET